MRLVLAVPTYGPTEPEHNRYLRTAIMHAANNGHQWLGDSSPNRESFEAARNNVVQSVIDNTTEYPDDAGIFWCDSDVTLPVDAITLLANTGKDFVCGIYYQRRKPHWPLVTIFNEKTEAFNFVCEWPENVVVPVDGCGFGCVITSLAMLRKMPAPWFKFEKFSEDFDFCLKARAAGYQLYCNTAVDCGHLMDPKPATREQFLPEWERMNKVKLGGNDGTQLTGVERAGQTGNLAVPEDGDATRANTGSSAA